MNPPSREQPDTGGLAGRIAIVTGATAGIGLATAAELVRHGARVVMNARRPERLDQVASHLNAGWSEARVATVAGDCADPRVIGAMFETAHRAFAADPDLIVVNAGRGLAGSVITSDEAQWEEMIRTNLLGAARLIRQASRRMLGGDDPGRITPDSAWVRRSRDIIVLGSVVGRHVSPYSSMYGSTKFAVHGLAEGARRELAPHGIRVSLIEPGFVVSEFQGVAGYKDEWFRGVLERLGPVLEPADVARMVAFICEQPAHVHISDLMVRPVRQDYP